MRPERRCSTNGAQAERQQRVEEGGVVVCGSCTRARAVHIRVSSIPRTLGGLSSTRILKENDKPLEDI